MLQGLDRIATLIVNFRTLVHTRACIDSVREFYPTLHVLVIDNGSADASTEHLRARCSKDEHLDVLFNSRNVFHGPALDQGMHALDSHFVFVLDSDCELKRGGFLEPLIDEFARDDALYAIGKRGWANRRGYPPVDRRQPHTPYIHPFAAIFDRRKYLDLPPFIHHGAPLYRNMWGARKRGYHLRHVDIEDYVLHHGKVTASTHGYGYDRRLKFQAGRDRVERAAFRAVASALRRPLEPPLPPPPGYYGRG